MTPKTTNGDSNCDPQALVNLGIKVVEEEVKMSGLPEGYYFSIGAEMIEAKIKKGWEESKL